MNFAVRLKLKIERELHQLRFHGQCVSLEHALRQQSSHPAHSIAVPAWRTISTGEKLHNSYLANILRQEELGTWALDAQTLNFLEQEIIRLRPQAILEFGTGISTICFARHLFEIWGDTDKPRVFSIEQNEWQVEKSQRQLVDFGLEKSVRILHAPLTPQRIEDITTECYALPPSVLNEFLGELRPDFVVVDGPSGNSSVRFGTLPLVKAHVQETARFYLDDALRPEELDVAERWNALSYLSLSELRKIGKGILTGRMVPAADPAGSA